MPGGGVSLLGGFSLPGGLPAGGALLAGSAYQGGLPAGGFSLPETPPVDRITHM